METLRKFSKILKYYEKDCIVCIKSSVAELLINPNSKQKKTFNALIATVVKYLLLKMKHFKFFLI